MVVEDFGGPLGDGAGLGLDELAEGLEDEGLEWDVGLCGLLD